MKPAIIYGRVSTAKQDYNRQLDDLKKYAAAMGYDIVKVFTDTASGTTKKDKRQGIREMLTYLDTHKISIVLCSEISRLGRSAFDVQQTINEIVNERKVNLYIDQQGLTAFTKDGKHNMTFKLITDVLANVAQMELEQLKERTISGQRRAWEILGKQKGRPTGTTEHKDAILKKYKNVVKQVKDGQSLRNTAKICGVSINTVRKVKSLMDAA